MLIKVLAHAGLDTEPMDPVFGEHQAALRIDKEILRVRGYRAWERTDEVAERVGESVRRLGAEALKDTALPHTLDVWWASRKDLKVLVCQRRLDAVVRSFMTAYPRGQRELRVLGYPESIEDVPTEAWPTFSFGQLMDILESNRIPYGFFHYPEDIRGPGPAWDRLQPMLEDAVSRPTFVASMWEVADRHRIHW
jgi:hypothetical protein